MSGIQVKYFVWIISGLSLFLLVWGGLGALQVASSSVAVLALEATPTPELRTYSVEPGDTLWSIAVKFYGNGAKYTLLQQANNLPDNTRLRNGQILVIPFSEMDRTPTPKTLPTASATATPALTNLPSPSVISTAMPAKQPFATTTPSVTPSPVAKSSDPGIASFIPILSLVLNVLGVICLLGSLVCAVLSYDIYRRSRHYARRRYIGNRVRAGL